MALLPYPGKLAQNNILKYQSIIIVVADPSDCTPQYLAELEKEISKKKACIKDNEKYLGITRKRKTTQEQERDPYEIASFKMMKTARRQLRRDRGAIRTLYVSIGHEMQYIAPLVSSAALYALLVLYVAHISNIDLLTFT